MTLHPFSDGNGRTSPLLMNLMLGKAGYPPVVILPEDKPAYFGALDATRSGGRQSYQGFMNTRLEASLDHHLEILQRGGRPDLSPSQNRVFIRTAGGAGATTDEEEQAR